MSEFTLPDGHRAGLCDPAEVPVRRKRPLQIILAQLGTQRFQQIILAQQISEVPADATDEERQAAGEQSEAAVHALQLTSREWELLFAMTDANLYALVESLTAPDGSPLPVPGSPDGWQDTTQEVYEPLAVEVSRVLAEHMLRNGFTVDSVEHPDSPTGASDTSDH